MNRANTALNEVRDLYISLIAAWNRANAEAFATLFSNEGSLVGFDGSTMHGRSEIEHHLREIFDHHQTATYVSLVRSVRMLGEAHALLEAVAGMVPPGGSDIKPEVNVVQCLVATKTGDRWLIEHYQNTPAAFHGRPDAQRVLSEELRWLLPQRPGK